MSGPLESLKTSSNTENVPALINFCPKCKVKLLNLLSTILIEVSASNVTLRLKSRSISQHSHLSDKPAEQSNDDVAGLYGTFPDKGRRASDKGKVPNGDYILQIGESFQAKHRTLHQEQSPTESYNTMSTPIYSQRRLVGELLIETPPDIEPNNSLRIYLLNMSETVSIIVSGNSIPKQNKDFPEQAYQTKSDENDEAFPSSVITDTSSFFRNIDLEKEHPAISKAIIYISEHYRKNFCMKQLSKACYISPSHLSNLFNKRFGMSFKKILTHFRVEKAKDILREMPARQITQVCIDVGFFDLSHFEKTFKKTEGVSPTTYRTQHRKHLDITKKHT